ncbi:CK1 family protein kinase [Trichomonas vaginalis G3]|uniref:non-specific serine/threonine protein kinase n=1 Tax=Trichomonas vaginalis (strain ATCC PRA-98 / G3) TaxID=412133 RepID=A2DDQ1_TRIV3|nr:STKc CK1 domain-containing protein [Trichomonas vaginalis G3]EAY21427.1 CK1 family protein kinase [Trichomonas vaginalis G3]KAI5490639.1 STKc CK1 domain-containing protein [Trichomonas vaginalis G3]|eukprot:XP_001582413.1 CK1 family protein kinase [Trichomonas vaginalis G3]
MNKPHNILFNRFRLIRRIGQGSFGQIFACEDLEQNIHAALKIEHAKTSAPQLPYEAKLYKVFAGCINIPNSIFYGTEKFENVLVMDLCGKSLEDLLKLYKKFSLKTVLMLATQMISAIEFIHKKDYIHRDVKPDNFVMGRGKSSSTVIVIDFGLSKRYRDSNTLQHVAYSENKSLTGTARYASVAVLNGAEPSRRDDMESLGYVWIYLLTGTLPWMGLGAAAERDAKYEQIRKKKETTSIETLCKGLPIEFIEYFEIVRAMKFEEEPKYTALRDLFRRLFVRQGFAWDYKYDWTDTYNNMKARSKTPESSPRIPKEQHTDLQIPVKPVVQLYTNYFTTTQAIQKKKKRSTTPRK